MIVQRMLALVVVPVFIFYFVYALNHRTLSVKGDPTLNVGRLIGRLAGSPNKFVHASAFGMQLGCVSIILWYLLMIDSNIEYIKDNAYVASLIFGVFTGLIFAKIFSSLSCRN